MAKYRNFNDLLILLEWQRRCDEERYELDCKEGLMAMKKILLIDDEADIREVAGLTLETMGDFEVFSAANGFEGVRIAAAVQPDVVLLDVMMPEIDGPSTLALLRETLSTREIPVIFMTAKVQASDRRKLSELGARGIISKPFDPMSLANEVLDILNGAVTS